MSVSVRILKSDQTYEDYTGVSKLQLCTCDGGTAIFQDTSEIITPTGELEITSNGVYDISQYSSVNINVPTEGDPVTINTDTTYEFELAHNIDYRRDTLETLTLTLPDSIPTPFECQVCFTSGSTATVVTLPEGVVLKGDDVSDGVFTPVANCRYNLLFWNDGVYTWCAIYSNSAEDSGDDNTGTDPDDPSTEPDIPEAPEMTGDGTEGSPWMITEASQLVALGAKVDASDAEASSGYYALANDIDLAGIDWNPIGADLSESKGGTAVGFSGTLDGQGHVIRNISINSTTIQYAGLFGGYFDGTLMNLGMEGGSITTTAASSTVGALARKLVSTTSDTTSIGKIVNCYSRVPCAAVTRSSGLIDAVENGGIVAGCYQAAAIKDGSGYAIKAEPVNSGTIDYCLWNKDLTANGIASNSSANSAGLTTAEFATAASTLNANMNAVANLAGVDVTKLCTWEDGEDGYPVLVPGSYGTPDSGDDNEETEVPTAYTLTISKGVGVESVTVTKTSGYGTTGTLSSGATVYQGDVLSVTAIASSGYTLNDHATSITVSNDVTVTVTATANSSGFDGAGTEANPYLIATAAELKTLADEVDAGDSKSGVYYALSADIDLSEYVTWDPIGAKDKSSSDMNAGFAGVLDGRGNIITGMNVGSCQYGGLFGSNFTGTILNLGIEDSTVDVSGYTNSTCGSFARKMTSGNGKIVNCYSLADCKGAARSSGIVDEMASGDIVAGVYFAGTSSCNTSGADYAIKSAKTTTGTLAYCYWEEASAGTGYSTTTNVTNCESKTSAELTAELMNGNLETVATVSGIDVAKLCTWEDHEDGYPRLVVKSA